MAEPANSVKAPAITTAVFGGVFDVDGAGHYPGLELINFVVCSADGILPPDGPARLTRATHDFARRLVTDRLPIELRKEVLIDNHSAHAVSRLLRCLELDVPNVVKTKSWERTHFFPYTRSLVHWDARTRGSSETVQLERRYLRGGGAYAYSVLRRDPDAARLEKVRLGFERLYPAGGSSPLELLGATLRDHGVVDKTPVLDQIEPESVVRDDRWDNLLRDGMANILGHESLPAVQRVRAVVNWTGICLVLLECGRAAERLNRPGGLVLDCAGTHSQLRRASQKSFKEQLSNVEDAARSEARQSNAQISAQQMNKIKAFMSGTAGTCGLLNAAKGRRHLVLRLEAIETLVMAALRPGREQDFEAFATEWLFERCSLVVGRQAAHQAGLLSAFDASIFEENERRLADQIRAAGMLRVYSDATRMVSVGGTQ
ncbi:hypothetical protein J7E70_26375 [Variovorax paradoxus]|nr:hypothetical protein [Variovorax paradoxus]MBT2303973.1 hypothetical protein [Variovorax paradoxus]